ncbi:MAG: alpha/beta fold hydrolase [Sphingomonadales bacterium]|nr:MAG: alpha/beta fold hydrolase [Sphingomonadales bacterium]
MTAEWIGEAPQLHVVWAGSGAVAAVVVTGMANAAATRAAQLSATLDGRRVGAISLPSLAALDADAMAARIAAFLDNAGGALPLLVADDLAGGLTALVVPRLAHAPHKLALIGRERALRWRKLSPPPGDIRIDGTHLAALWHFLRDLHIDAEDGEAIPDAAALSAAFLEAAEDPAAYAALWRMLATLPVPRWDRVTAATEGGVIFPEPPPGRRRMVDTPRGAMHVRLDGKGQGRPLLLLHHGPGATPVIDDVILGLGKNRRTIAPDFLGCGRSDKIDAPVTIETLATDMLALLDALELQTVDIFGTHTGAFVALQMAIAAPDRIGRVILEGFTPPITADADAIMRAYPMLAPAHSGTHLAEAWTMRRDMFRFVPFTTPVRAAQRHLTPAGASFLHRWTMTLLHGAPTFRHVMRAAFAYDGAAALAQLTRPAMICAGPEDSLYAGLAATAPIAPACVTIRETPATLWHPAQGRAAIAATLAIYLDFLNG